MSVSARSGLRAYLRWPVDNEDLDFGCGVSIQHQFDLGASKADAGLCGHCLLRRFLSRAVAANYFACLTVGGIRDGAKPVRCIGLLGGVSWRSFVSIFCSAAT
jgi:hypothetical protein